MRAVMAVVVGILVGFAVMLAIALLGAVIFPDSGRIEGFTAGQAEQLAAVFPTLAMGAKIFILLSWFGGALAGAAVAKRMTGRGWAAWTIAAIFALFVLLNVLILPMPSWLQVVAVAAPLLGGLIANHLIAARPAAAAAAAPEPEPEADGAL